MEQQPFFVGDRGLLDSLLDEPRTSLMLILGKEGSREEKLYYEILSHVREPWRRVALIVSAAILTPKEKTGWRLTSAGHYVVLATPTDGSRKPVQKGQVSTLLGPSGSPSLLRLRKAFARADPGFTSKS